MENIFTIGILLFFFGGTIMWILRALFAGARTVVTGESFSEAMGSMPPITARLTKKQFDTDKAESEYYSVEIKGQFPLSSSVDVTCLTSILDVTDGEDNPKFVLSHIDAFQEESSSAFGSKAPIGIVSGDQGFSKWVEVSKVFPFILQTPFSGSRKLKILIRLMDSDDIDQIQFGFGGNDNYWVHALEVRINQKEKGYQESFEERNEGMTLCVKLAMSVAMSDGSFDKKEGQVIKKWMTKAISHLSDDKKKEMKVALNSAMSESNKALKSGTFLRSPIIKRLNKINDTGMKYDVMELCYDVMAADGKADKNEITELNQIGTALKLDNKELEKIRDMRMIDLSGSIDENDDPQTLLGIDATWSKPKVKSHLMNEFKKWNSRLNSSSEKKDREHAQRMLDLIGEERKKL